MEMRQIDYFNALCDERNFTRAARRCRVAQPSLTNGIKTLEAELGGALFTRRPRVALTALGRAVAPYLRLIARNVAEARGAARELASLQHAALEQRPVRPPVTGGHLNGSLTQTIQS